MKKLDVNDYRFAHLTLKLLLYTTLWNAEVELWMFTIVNTG